MNLLFGYSKIHHVRLQLSQLTAISGGRGFLVSDLCQQLDGELMRGYVPPTHHLVTVGQQGGQNILRRKQKIPIQYHFYNFIKLLCLFLQLLQIKPSYNGMKNNPHTWRQSSLQFCRVSMSVSISNINCCICFP